jgi:GNAT superfamily N-acetyltransferase
MQAIEAIERATLDAVPPQRLDTWDTWLLGLDAGTVGRCHSAVPLRHGAPRADSLVEIERRYRAAGRPPVLRIPEVATFDALRRELAAHGYRHARPTLVQTAPAELRVRSDAAAEVAITTAPGGDWEQVFLGEGFDPVDGASRLEILRRGKDSLFASVRQHGRTVAVGAACLSQGWCGVHGMRTLPAWRGRGLAGAILAALAAAARARGLQQVFLQVDAGNEGARSLYARAGFATRWSYAYWARA